VGGNVFKNNSTRRYSAKDYHALVDRLRPLLEKISDKFEVIPAYLDKQDFGDVDVLIIPNRELSKQTLNEIFSSRMNVERNGSVWSLVFEDIQVDLITTNRDDFAVSLDYFSWNDFGNLRGKIIHRFGLKFGHRGLIFPISDGKNIVGDIVLSKDPDRINKIFEFKPKQFKTLEDMFDCVIDSCFFSPELFSFEEMNAVARIRDKKRSSYISFLKYIESITKGRDRFYEYSNDKKTYHHWIFYHFPEARPEYDRILESIRLRKLSSEKFNGDLVREWTGCEGPELGRLIVLIKSGLTQEMILDMSEEDILRVVQNRFIEMSEQC
jgi:hypothetical protein